MRYLSYHGNQISYTESSRRARALSTSHAKISNMRQCTNLRNIYSYNNVYRSDDIVPLRNLRKIYSWNDEYQQNSNSLI